MRTLPFSPCPPQILVAGTAPLSAQSESSVVTFWACEEVHAARVATIRVTSNVGPQSP
jgi:hypothetical protein